MSRAAQLIADGTARGLLPEDASLPAQETRPWPVVLLTALGAWLAAVPLLGVVGMLLGGVFGAYLSGVLLLVASVVILRARELPVFVEQLALPALVVGTGALGIGLFRDLPERGAAALLCVIALGLCVLIQRPWLRVLLGAAAAALFMALVVPFDQLARTGGMDSFWVALHLTLAAWVAAFAVQQALLDSGRHARLARLVESAGAGWLLPVLAGLAVQAGLSLLVAGSLGGWAGLAGQPGRGAGGFAMPGVSLVLALVAVFVAGRRWPSLRRPAAAFAGVVLAGLALFLPSLGAVLLALALTATTQRWRLAAAAALAAAWIVGAFYYQLAWPLATKAVVLVATGAALAAAAWLASRGGRATAALAAPAGWDRRTLLVPLTAALVLVVANGAIWQKERLIATGDKVYVPLAPVDPRSLLQGDFMRLNFAVPAAGGVPGLTGAERPHAIAKRDARGVAQIVRLGRARDPLQAGEFRIELTPKDGQWILVTDAWFFREGEAAKFEQARFGEFRVAPDGKALLVGLADGELRDLGR